MLKTFSLLFLTIFFTSIYCQTTAIPDTNFEQGLIDLGLDSGTPDGVVTTASIDTVTFLDVSNLSMTDLTGIEDFVSLTHLHCYYNDITSMDLSQNTALKVLYASWNGTNTSIDVSTCTLLETIDFSYNDVSTFDMTPLTSLISIDCGFNNITALDPTQNNNLSTLKCYYNQLTTLDVTSNLNLKILNFEDNDLTTIDVSANAALEYLGCSNNQISVLDVSHNLLLENLYCDNNLLTQLNVYPLTHLKTLECQFNSITELNLTQTSDLIRIRCNDNDLACLNMQNGQNTNMGSSIFEPFTTTNNPNLTCVTVDDVAFSDTYWVDIDGTTSFSTSCGSDCTITLGVEQSTNSTTKRLIKITDLLGRETKYQPNVILIYFYSDGSYLKTIDIR